jgi:nucleoside permease NupC
MGKLSLSITNGTAAIAAGSVAFFAVGGLVFGATYLILPLILPKPEGVARLAEGLYVVWCWLFGAVAGSIVGGYLTARVAERNQFIYAAVVVAMLIALFWWITGPNRDTFGSSLAVDLTVIVSLLFLLGTWMGYRKRKQFSASS